jgi:hypothetical protein
MRRATLALRRELRSWGTVQKYLEKQREKEK